MSRLNEHLVVVMLDHMPAGQEFEVWPMHITIVPWFPCDDEGRLDETLSALQQKYHPFEVKTGRIEEWGQGKDRFKVLRVEDNAKLRSLHWEVLRALEKNGFPVHQKDYLGERYTPHITLRNSKADAAKFTRSRAVHIDRFTLVRQERLKGSGRMIKSLVKDYELR